MTTCKEIITLLSDYLEGDMPSGTRETFERHMSACPPCVVFLEDLRKTRSLVGGLRCEEVPDEVQRRLRSFLDRCTKGPRR
jgi:anti-sigma factor RsiW